MRPSFRNALLLGSAIVSLSSIPAYADDPLVPEGAERPVMGKELVLPPIINEAPANTEIVLPPPGQEHLLGARPAGAKPAEKIEARVADEPVTTAAAEETPAKKSKRKARAVVETAKAETADEKALYVGVEKTRVPEQANIVAEDKSAPAGKITQTDQRMADLTQPAMGGPELVGPPKPTDGMEKTPALIRNGDEISTRQADALSPKTNAPANAPAIERFEIAQATSTPMPVTPSRPAGPARDWDVELSASVGFGRIDTAAQNYFGSLAEGSMSGGGIGNLSENGFGPKITPSGIATDDEDDIVTYEVAAKINLTGDVEPLGGGSNVEPYLKIGVSGYEADFASRHDDLEPPNYDEYLVIPGVGGEGGYEFGGPPVLPVKAYEGDEWGWYNYVYNFVTNRPITDIVYKGNLQAIRGTLEYGQTWKGNSVDVTGFARITHTRRDIEHTLTFEAGNNIEEDVFDVAYESPGLGLLPRGGIKGKYHTDLEVNTTGFGLGAGLTVPLTRDKRWNADVSGYGSYDVTTVDGTDTLTLEGRVVPKGISIAAPPGSYVDSTRIKATEESFGYGATVGVSYDVTERFSVRLGADYTSQEASPVVVRDGINPSYIKLEREDVIVGTLTAKIKL